MDANDKFREDETIERTVDVSHPDRVWHSNVLKKIRQAARIQMRQCFGEVNYNVR